MDIFSIILIAIGLAMDCFAVSVSKGICVRKFYIPQSLLMAFLFGLFQGIMPLISFLAGISFANFISRIDHWIALILLCFIGGKMIVESLRKKQDSCHSATASQTESASDVKSEFSLPVLLSLAIATSIDALATGLIFVPTPQLIWIAIGIIGTVSFLFSMAGMYIGVYFGKRFHINVELIGGIILVGIGLKIWIEHLFFS